MADRRLSSESDSIRLDDRNIAIADLKRPPFLVWQRPLSMRCRPSNGKLYWTFTPNPGSSFFPWGQLLEE
jgi:hypothetical protein